MPTVKKHIAARMGKLFACMEVLLVDSLPR
jgi:hypothetical protein